MKSLKTCLVAAFASLAMMSSLGAEETASDRHGRLDGNYAVTFTLEADGDTTEQAILIASRDFSFVHEELSVQASFVPQDAGTALFEYDIEVPRIVSRGDTNVMKAQRWHSSVLLPPDQEMTIIEGDGIRVSVSAHRVEAGK